MGRARRRGGHTTSLAAPTSPRGVALPTRAGPLLPHLRALGNRASKGEGGAGGREPAEELRVGGGGETRGSSLQKPPWPPKKHAREGDSGGSGGGGGMPGAPPDVSRRASSTRSRCVVIRRESSTRGIPRRRDVTGEEAGESGVGAVLSPPPVAPEDPPEGKTGPRLPRGR